LEKTIFDTDLIKKQFIRLLERKREIEPQYGVLKAEMESLNGQITGLEQALIAAGIDTIEIVKKVKPTSEQIKVTPKEDTLPDIIYKILAGVRKPMHYVDIEKNLRTVGYKVGGQNPANTVLAYIGRNKSRFQKAPEVGRGYYKIIQ